MLKELSITYRNVGNDSFWQEGINLDYLAPLAKLGGRIGKLSLSHGPEHCFLGLQSAFDEIEGRLMPQTTTKQLLTHITTSASDCMSSRISSGILLLGRASCSDPVLEGQSNPVCMPPSQEKEIFVCGKWGRRMNRFRICCVGTSSKNKLFQAFPSFFEKETNLKLKQAMRYGNGILNGGKRVVTVYASIRDQ